MGHDPGVQQRSFGASLDVDIDLPLAGAASRGLARMVDLLILSIVQFAVWVGVGAVFGVMYAAKLASVGPLIGAGLLIVFLMSWFASTALELWFRGQPPGKKLLGLRVVRDDGGELTLVPSLLRNLLRLDNIPGGMVFDLAFMLVSDDGKRFGDLAAGTVVVDEAKVQNATRAWPLALAAREVALLEQWYQRAPNLEPERRQAIAEKLVAKLSAAHPGLVPEGAPVLALEQLAPVS